MPLQNSDTNIWLSQIHLDLISLSGGTGSSPTYVQNGLNTFTGGTPSLPTVNVTGLTLSGASIIQQLISEQLQTQTLQASNLSGGTIFSGATELSLLFPQQAQSGTQLIGTLMSADLNSILDQPITLSGGNTYLVTDVLITNASTYINLAQDGEIWDGLLRSGNPIMQTNTGGQENLSSLFSPQSFINNYAAQLTCINNNFPSYGLLVSNGTSSSVTQTNTVYFSLATPQGTTATADIYVFGFILN